jgi:hypothetical protein
MKIKFIIFLIKKILQISTNNVIINNKSYCFDYMIIGLGSQKLLKNWADELKRNI